MSHKNLAFHKINLIICGVAVLVIIAGFLLMSGPATTFDGFEPDIFSARRIKVAPLVCLAGFVLMIVGILYPAKDRKKEEIK
ncbi:MAG TPA: DUF3098 domain-containing protein [Porphyromonadaceae bacterium]|jgi:hypothetical protein|uniref:DUF3098 domain-containing protein n=1 Tax=Petrimonas TaxID=307628 RepID=UPI000E97CBEC|nr:DUF3098 domain-containing protein [Petrimonas sp.]BBD45953.1 Hypothetical protein PEIBARAKI_5946 [Petrimonas sp. IBARAKI]HBC39394.1 DUF3098 domain-containing protein [Porphyromonadaceae bacterium]MDD3542206.1 DUF3098 domain-containing protein [Petrimonas sp.]MDD4016257.1 DUF3098 domain-containing protein [Petrimonas sp.]